MDQRMSRLCKIRRQCANAWRLYYVKQVSRGHAGRGVGAFSDSLLDRRLRTLRGGGLGGRCPVFFRCPCIDAKRMHVGFHQLGDRIIDQSVALQGTQALEPF